MECEHFNVKHARYKLHAQTFPIPHRDGFIIVAVIVIATDVVDAAVGVTDVVVVVALVDAAISQANRPNSPPPILKKVRIED